MSTWLDEEVGCPSCASRFPAPLARGVHVARAPEVRDMLFARAFHRVTCPHCGGAFTARRELVYTDMDRKQWFQVANADQRVRWPELEDLADAVFDRAFIGAPAAAALRDGFRRRLVFGFEELREKLVIWRAALDDAVVECLKVDAIAREPELSRATSIVVDEVLEDGALRVVVDGERVFGIPAARVDAFHGDARLPARFPELFGGRYVSIYRLLGPRYRWAEPKG